MGRYEKIKKIGSGGEGEVWLARDHLRGAADVALKYILGADERLQKIHLSEEFHILASLSHPRLARVFDFGKEGATPEGAGGRFFFTRQYIEGRPLAPPPGGEDAAKALGTFIEVLRALKPLHRSGIVHGDLKPSNIIVTDGGQVRLIDFSMSREVKDPEKSAGGTLLYLPPEVILGQPSDTRSDLYSAGLILMELLLGRHPLSEQARKTSEIIKAHVEGRITLPRDGLKERGEAAGKALDLARLLTRPDPPGRPASVEEVEAWIRNSGVIEPPDDPYERRSPITFSRASRLEKESIARFLGRLGRVEAAWCAVTISGPPGSGRSSLLREIKWHLQMRGVPLVELELETAAAREAAVSSLGQQLQWALEGLQDEARPAGVPRRPGAFSPEDIAGIVRRWPEPLPLAILIDDVDRSAPAFMELIGRLQAVRLKGGGAVVAASDSSRETLFDSLPFDERYQASLAPASEEEIAVMLRTVAGRDDPATVRWIRDLSGGNYAIASEAVERVASSGPSFNLDEERSLTQSQWLRGRWQEKFESLAGDDRKLIGAVALSYEAATLEEAAAAAGIGSAEDAAAAAGRSRDFLRSDPSGKIEMTSGFLRNVIAALLPDEERRHLHGAWAERCRGRSPAAHALMHLAEAGDVEGARGPILEEAARQKAGGRLGECILLIETLLRGMEEDSTTAVEPRLLLSESLLEAGRVAEAAEKLVGLDTGGQKGLETRKEIIRGGCRIAAGSAPEGTQILEKIAGSRKAAEEARCEAIAALSDALLRRGSYDAALEWIEGALGLESCGIAKFRIPLLCTRGTVHLYRHMKHAAQQDFDRAHAAATQQGEASYLIRVLGYQAMAEQMWGNLARALDLHREAAGLCQKQGFTGKLAQNYVNLATILHRQGDFDGSINYYLSAIDYASRSGQRAVLANARINYAMLLGFLGMIQQARYEAGRAEIETEGLGQSALEARMHAVQGEVAARAGDWPEARRRFRIADDIFGKTGNRWEAAEVRLEIVDTMLPTILGGPAPGRDADIEELLRGSGEVALEADGTLLQARYFLAEARHLWVLGSRDESRSRLEKALGICQSIKEEFDDFSWQIHFLLSQMKVVEKDHESALRHIEKAASIIENLEHQLPQRFRASFRKPVGRQKVFEMLGTLSMRKPSTPAESETLRQMVSKLVRITGRLASERDLASLINLILDSAIEVTGAERGFLLMPDESGAPGVVTARDFDTLRVPEEHIEFSRSIARQVLEGGEAVYTISATKDERFANARSVHELGLQSIICIPIRKENRTAGAIYLEHHSSRALLIPPGEKDLLGAFADQAAIAIETARLFRENKRRLQEIEFLSQEREKLLERRTRALREAQKYLRSARELFSEEIVFRGIVGASAGMKKIFETIRRLDESDVPVVIVGESGTGKELVARAIHGGSARSRREFVPINCGALPPQLLESELFGYVKGAFTGAAAGRRGIFSTASGGTLLLDEIGEMPLKMQIDLLRVLQEGKVRPVGSSDEEKVDVRVLAASQTPLENLIKKGDFREDLYYRLNVVTIPLPPLRGRVEDIPLLVDHFLSGFSVKMKTPKKIISRRAMKLLVDYPWYGNVRELENAVLSAWVLEEGKLLDLDNFEFLLEKEHLPSQDLKAGGEAPHPAGTPDEEKERRRIIETLRKCRWNKSRAAELLGIPRRTFYRKLKKFDVQG